MKLKALFCGLIIFIAGLVGYIMGFYGYVEVREREPFCKQALEPGQVMEGSKSIWSLQYKLYDSMQNEMDCLFEEYSPFVDTQPKVTVMSNNRAAFVYSFYCSEEMIIEDQPPYRLVQGKALTVKANSVISVQFDRPIIELKQLASMTLPVNMDESLIEKVLHFNHKVTPFNRNQLEQQIKNRNLDIVNHKIIRGLQCNQTQYKIIAPEHRGTYRYLLSDIKFKEIDKKCDFVFFITVE